MDKFLHRTCAAVWVCTSLIPAGAQVLAHEHQYPQIDVKTESLEFRQFDRVEVTGSAILSKESKETLPVQVITQRDIERSGSSNLPDLLQRLPVMANFSENGTLPTSAGGPQSAAIHGYASGTLVLLNGRRLPYYGNNSIDGERAFVDLNLLPLSAIDRIELLTDGASTRYGSDAIAGVVNIITKASLQGTTLSSQLTRPEGGQAHGEQLNLSWGKGKVDTDGFNLQVHLTLEKQNPLFAKDREASREAVHSFDAPGQKLWALGYNITPHGWPASIQHPDGSTSHPTLTQTGQCPAQWYKLSNGQVTECYRNAQSALTVYPGLDKKQIFASGEMKLPGHWRAFSQLLWGEYVQSFVSKDSYDLIAPLSDGRFGLFTSQPLGPITQAYTNTSHHITVGLRGEIQDWDLVASLSSGEHRVVREYTGGVIRSAKRRALQDSGFTVDELAQDQRLLSATTLDKFTPYQQSENLRLDDGRTRLSALDLLASRELFSNAHGAVSLGLGLNWRIEEVFNLVNPVLNNAQRPNFETSRHIMAVHAEVQVPVSANNVITAAVRQDMYSDFDAVQTGKLAWRWRPTSDLMLRGAIGTGFRAPSLGQMLPLSTSVTYYPDPITGTNVQTKYFGNPELKPERAVQSSLGLRWEPNPTWSLGADVWTLRLKDTFGALSSEQIFTDPALRTQYLIEGEDGYLQILNKNLGHAFRQGIDYDVQWRQPTSWGRFRWSFHGTLNLQSKSQFAPNNEYLSDLGRFNPVTYTVTPRHQFMTSWALEQSNRVFIGTLNYRSGNTENARLLNIATGEYANMDHNVASFWTLDLAARWQSSRQWTWGAHIGNVTQNKPPLRLMTTGILNGVDTRYANYYGRTLKFKAEYKF